MDFNVLYRENKSIKLNCDLSELFNIHQIFFGSGGSKNIIIHVTDKESKNDMIIKVIPQENFTNVKIIPDRSQLETKFYQFFTTRYLLTDRTPHIVGCYNHHKCSEIDDLIEDLLVPYDREDGGCPSYREMLTKKTNMSHIENILCNLKMAKEYGKFVSNFDMILLEYCPSTLTGFMFFSMKEIASTIENTDISTEGDIPKVILKFIRKMNRILFQLIFTLAIIKDDYPGFLHNDFFMRNILLSNVETYSTNDYIAYHYKQRIFYLPANGYYAKINDFDRSIIINELEYNTYQIEKESNKDKHIDPFSQKTDLFNLLHDIYDGDGYYTNNINTLINNFKIPGEEIRPIKQFMDTYINIRTIDRINSYARDLLNDTWHIDGLTILEKSILTPEQYLTSDLYKVYQTLPKNAKIIKHYNKPKQAN